MKHLMLFENFKINVFEGINTDKHLEAEEVKPGMIGILNDQKTGERYPIRVIKIQKIGDLSENDYKIFRNNNSGWLPPYIRDIVKYDKDNEEVEAAYPEILDEYLVLIQTHPDDDRLKEVYFYDQHQITCPVEQRWMSSKTLTDANAKTGVFEKFKNAEDVKNTIMRLHKLPKEYKEEAAKLIDTYSIDGQPGVLTNAKNGKVSSLRLHPELEKKLKDKNWPRGFSMGIDKNGYYIHTHRARGKSYKTVDEIPFEEIKFIDSTG